MGRYESPDYEVVLEDGDVQIRKYAGFSAMEYDNANDPYNQNGFGTLFNYISGANDKAVKMEMTVPVFEQLEGSNKKMAFVIPAQFRDNVPKPQSGELDVVKFDGGMYAVIRYGGLTNSSKESREVKLLREWLDEHGYKVRSAFYLAQYNSPFALPVLRRNEILVRLDSENE